MGDSSRDTSKFKMILKAIDVAFSMYSKIPMPRFTWGSSDMKYHLCFFPFVGAVIGGLEYGWFLFAGLLNLGEIIKIMIAITIPLLITGGFHVDGYMDTMDAFHSYQPREKKLEILKDPHIGAFSVICLTIYMLLAVGFLSEINNKEAVAVLCFSFFIARALSGLSLMYFKNAKDTGMLSTSKETADKKIVKVSLEIELILALGLMLFINWKYGAISIATFAITFLYYYRMSKKNFGGITGDLAGFYVCISELFSLATVSILNIFI